MRYDAITELKLLPVCDCGYVFTEGIEMKCSIIPIYDGEQVIKHATFDFIPFECPNCKRRIVAVTDPTNKIKMEN